MSTRILWQCDPNNAYQCVAPINHVNATAGELPILTICKDYEQLKKWLIPQNCSPTPACPPIQFPIPQICQNPPTFNYIIPRYYPHAADNTLRSTWHCQTTVEQFKISNQGLVHLRVCLEYAGVSWDDEQLLEDHQEICTCNTTGASCTDGSSDIQKFWTTQIRMDSECWIHIPKVEMGLYRCTHPPELDLAKLIIQQTDTYSCEISGIPNLYNRLAI